MIALWMQLALAQQPAEPDPVHAVRGVSWARPFTLAEPAAYRMRADRPTFDRGWIVQLDVEPGTGLARAVDSPVLYIGDLPARRVQPDPRATCLVAWVPGDLVVSSTPIFLGDPVPPERVDPQRAASLAAAARAVGAPTFAPAEVAPALRATDLDAVWAAALDRAKVCHPPE